MVATRFTHVLWCSFFCLSSPVFGQNNIPATLESARAYLTQNDLKPARLLFKNVLQQDKKNASALSGLGEIAFRERDWKKVKRHFKKVLKIDAADADAHYFSGIAHRETGKFKGPLLREFDLSKSIHHLRFLTENQPKFKDCFYQLALTFRQKKRYTTVIELIQRQIEIKPELDTIQVDLLRHYRSYLRHTDAKEASRWLMNQTWEQAEYFLGELARRSGDLPQAMAIFKTMLKKHKKLSIQPILLSIAKAHFAHGDFQQAESAIHRAIEETASPLDALFLFSELKYIFSQEELDSFGHISRPQDFQRFFQVFWRKRNPTPAAALNPRLIEHLRRILYAENAYEFDGLRSWNNNPDKLKWLNFPPGYNLNKEFNDKGLIYIRHGEPDERVFTLGESVPINESWRYSHANGRHDNFFHFFSSPGNNWRLGSVIEQREILTDLAHWDPIYYRLTQGSPLEKLALESELANQLNNSIENGFTTDRHTFAKSVKALDTPFTSATFRGKTGKTRFDLYVGVPTKPIVLASKDRVADHRLEIGFAVHDSNWQPIHQELRTQQIISGSAENLPEQQELLLYSHEIAPQKVHVAFHVRPENSDFLGGVKFETDIPAYSLTELDMSDVILAYGIQPATVNSNYTHYSLDVIPNPANEFHRTQPVNIYFEIYNLKLDDRGTCNYSIEYNLSLVKKKNSFTQKMFGFLQKKQKESITLRNSQEGNSEFNVEYVGLDIRNMAPGEYRLRILVHDKNTEMAVMRDKNLTID